MADSIQASTVVSFADQRKARDEKAKLEARLQQHIDELPEGEREGVAVKYYFAVMCLGYFQVKQQEGCMDYEWAIPALRKITARGPDEPAPLWVEVGPVPYSQMRRQTVIDLMSTLAAAFDAKLG